MKKNDVQSALGTVIGACIAIAAVLLVVWGALLFLGFLGNGIRDSWNAMTHMTPEQKAAQEKRQKEWETDPRNPKVAGQKCLDLGGVPDYSAWDGDVKECNKPGGGNIDIDIRQ
jgi:hypothetical protein